MKSLNFILFVTISYLFISCSNAETNMSVEIFNVSNVSHSDYPVMIEKSEILLHDSTLIGKKIDVWTDTGVIASQIIKSNGKETLLFCVDLLPNAKMGVKFKEKGEVPVLFNKRTHAELAIKVGGKWENRVYVDDKGFEFIDSLRVPNEHTTESYFVKYEGPGWESDKVAYRYYLDWRNAVDIFGKIATEVVLPQVGFNGYNSYHNLNDWGMDILKVGNSLGIGSIGTWDGKSAERVAQTDSVICVVREDGDLYSSIETNYYNWKSKNSNVNLNSVISIKAGSRMTHQELTFSGSLNNIATGIVKHNDLPLVKGPADTEWGYIATWGRQSLNNDSLGMVVFFKNSDVLEITSDAYSYVVVLQPEENQVDYYYAAMWEKENGKSYTREDFDQYVEEAIDALEEPVIVSWK